MNSMKPTQSKTRVKSGCVTCRIRRLKCDEGKPHCQRCRNSGRQCDGYTSVQISRRQLIDTIKTMTALGYRCPTASAVDDFGGDMVAHRHFDYFRNRTIPMTSAFLDSAFWSRLVLQIAHSEPAVRHAVLALSSLHQQFESIYHEDAPGRTSPLRIDDPNDELRKYALAQYNKALGEARRLVEKGNDIAKVLVTCVIFICYENLMGRFDAAQIHHKNGMRILSQQQQKRCLPSSSSAGVSRNDPEDTLGAISDILKRIDFQSMTLAHARSVYQYSATELMEEPDPPPPPSSGFSSISQASGYLMDQIRQYFKLSDALFSERISPTDFAARTQVCQYNMSMWDFHLRNLQEQKASFAEDSPPGHGNHKSGATVLRMYQSFIKIIIGSSTFGAETRWDPYLADFYRIVSLAEKLVVPHMQSRLEARSKSSSPPQQTTTLKGQGKPFTDRTRHFTPSLPTRPRSISATGNREYYSTPPPSYVVPTVESRTSPSPPPVATPVSDSALPHPPTKHFSFEPLGVITPLFFTSVRCRDPRIRRRAMYLLRSCHRQEGLWDSVVAAAVAERAMRIEEENLHVPPHVAYELESILNGSVGLPRVDAPSHQDVSASSYIMSTLPGPGPSIIAEACRIHTNQVVVDPERNSINLSCMMKPHGLFANWTTRNEVIEYAGAKFTYCGKFGIGFPSARSLKREAPAPRGPLSSKCRRARQLGRVH